MTAPERPTFYRRWLSPEGYLGMHLAAGFVIALAAGIVFGLIARRVFGAPEALLADDWARDVARRLTYPRLTALERFVTFFGTPPALISMTALVTAWLLRVKSHRRLYAFLAAMMGGWALNTLLKLYFARTRPADMGLLAMARGYSFPSGHAMCSMTFFGSLAYVLYFSIERHRRWRIPAVLGCVLATLVIGVSRIYLGVHYLSDVLAGWTAGLLWMAVCLSGVEGWVRWRDWRRRVRQRRGTAPSRKGRRHRQPTATLWTVLALGSLAAPGRAADQPPPCATCVAWEATPDQAARLLERPDSLSGLELVVRSGETVPPDLFRRLRARGVRAGWTQPLASSSPPPGALSTLLLVIGPEEDTGDLDAQAFQVKTAATAARAQEAGVKVGLEASASHLARLQERGLSAYVDFVIATGASAAAGPSAWIRVDGGSAAEVLEATRRSGADRFLARMSDVEIPLALVRLFAALPAGLAPLGEMRLDCLGEGLGCASEAFLDPETLDAVVWVRPSGTVQAVVTRPPAAGAILYALTASPATAPSGSLPAEAPGRWRIPGLGGPFVLRLSGWAGSAGRFASGVDVTEERPLSVEEVIARHQAAARRQAEAVPRLVASGDSVLTFVVPGLSAPMAVTARTVLYVGPDHVEMEERDLRLNGVAVPLPASGVPRLPLVEAERVSRPPLALALDEAYRYALVGRERAAGRLCYVVAFEPKEARGPLFRGRAWIAADDFGMVRTRATRVGLRGAIVSSEEEDEFVPVALGSRRVWLLSRTEAHQVYEGPGHRTPIHRVIRFESHEPNPPDFEARRRAAEASEAVMLRDTPDGLRYLRRAPAHPVTSTDRVAPTDPVPPTERALRVVADRATRVRALALGVVRDPNITVPLPFVALSYVDLDFLDRGGQVNVFAALGFVQAAWNVPSLGSSRWQLQGSAFATAVEYNDRSFQAGIERYDENLRQRPARLALSAARPLGPRLRLRAGYELGYVRLRRSDSTAVDFTVPPSPLTHALRVSLEGERGPWSGSVWWSPARRQTWRAWGSATSPEPMRRSFQRLGLSLSRSFVVGPRLVARVEGSALEGRGLDRFSRYTFDAFESRLRGYPSASLRFDRGAVLKSAAVWNPGRGVRLDAFADTAWVRDPGFGASLRPYPGVGAALESPAPLHTLLSLEWGYGFEARGQDGRRGTHVLRATLYRIF